MSVNIKFSTLSEHNVSPFQSTIGITAAPDGSLYERLWNSCDQNLQNLPVRCLLRPSKGSGFIFTPSKWLCPLTSDPTHRILSIPQRGGLRWRRFVISELLASLLHPTPDFSGCRKQMRTTWTCSCSAMTQWNKKTWRWLPNKFDRNSTAKGLTSDWLSGGVNAALPWLVFLARPLRDSWVPPFSVHGFQMSSQMSAQLLDLNVWLTSEQLWHLKHTYKRRCKWLSKRRAWESITCVSSFNNWAGD